MENYALAEDEEISIHAPTKGATLTARELEQLETISIHAPTKGATQQGACEIPYRHDFNPRSHEGSDRNNGS